jgi:hypothetical protein
MPGLKKNKFIHYGKSYLKGTGIINVNSGTTGTSRLFPEQDWQQSFDLSNNKHSLCKTQQVFIGYSFGVMLTII